MNPAPPLMLSILVATAGRIDSLRVLLAHLAACRTSDPHEIVVIDNACDPPLTAAALQTPGLPSLRIVRETRRGKSYALNRALDKGGLGEIIAVIDDDMSPAVDWIASVISACRRLPQFDIFAGRSHVVWPAGAARPSWACEPLAQGLLFSVIDLGSSGDVEFGIGAPRFPSGNHFWFRRSVLQKASRFPQAWATEASFVVTLRRLGHRGVFVPEALVGHRIQEDLIDAHKFLERARQIGRELAVLDMGLAAHPGRGALARVRSRLRPLRALAELGAWSVAWLTAWLLPERKRLPARARALWGIAYSRARLRPAPARARTDEESRRRGTALRSGDTAP